MDNRHTLLLVTEAVLNSQSSPDELILLLEVTTEEIVRKFPKKLVEHASKFGVYPDIMDDDDN